MTADEPPSGVPGKPAADDVAADMRRRLTQLEHDLEHLRRKVDAIEADPAARLAGDATAAPEGPLSRGATPRAAGHTAHEDAG